MLARSGQMLLAAGVLLGGSVPTLQAAGASREVRFFENQVRPLLVRHCFGCHGRAKQESGLRLDSRTALIKGGHGGAVVVPGQIEQSRLLHLVRRTGRVKMPPEQPLSAQQVAVLQEWIAQGAVFPVASQSTFEVSESGDFWSFRHPRSAPAAVPPGRLPGAESIDGFVAARLAREGLAAGGRANRHVLLRRASYDLTGLPPTAADVAAYAADETPDAFEKVVDRLLGSPAYGEKWGRHWLDVVRYADTAGETADFPVPQAYLYRNYVIDAHNADKPYDEFIREQVAGDMMAERLIAQRRMHSGLAGAAGFDPELTTRTLFAGDGVLAQRYRELVTATGFLAISRRFGFSADADHHLTIQDTIDTLGQVVLGLSLGCARCHDHKYDPVTTADYYAWYGIFASTQYAYPGSEGDNRPRDLTPVIPLGAARNRIREFMAEEKRVESELARLSARRAEIEKRLRPYASLVADVGPTEWIWNPYWSTVQGLLFNDYIPNDAGHQGYHVYRPAGRGIPLLAVNASDETLRVPGIVPAGSVVVHPDTVDGAAVAWVSPLDGRVRIAGSVGDVHDCGNGVRWHLDHLRTSGFQALATGAVGRAAVHRFGVEGSEREGHFEVDVRRGDLIQLAISMNDDLGCDLTRLELRIRSLGSSAQEWDLARDVVPDLYEEGEGNPHSDQTGNRNSWCFYRLTAALRQEWAAEKALSARELSSFRKRAHELREELERAVIALDDLQHRQQVMAQRGAYESVYGVVEGRSADARVHRRGDPTALGVVARRANLAILGGETISNGEGSGRLSLADWLTRDENPLTARVIANRIWQQHFGNGIVRTENDFGHRGDDPTHPALLDWLALQMMRSGWSMKFLHRRIMSSATYQQVSRGGEDSREIDPEGKWLWRFPRRRLSAEEIRDSFLFVAGVLDQSMGQSHPFPPVSSWNFTQHGPFYGLYAHRRRSIYTMQQRLKRNPFLALFDGPDPNATTAKRLVTTVPTQALYLMNSEEVHTAATALQRAIAMVESGVASQIRLAYRKTLARNPTASEIDTAQDFLRHYADRVDVAGAGQPGTQESLRALLRTLLVRNEFLFVD